MNYLRGALSAVSAASQYYKDLNPSTLTGAIDVIVVRRVTEEGAELLACSPFHVRFGKWQVLRPVDKKVRRAAPCIYSVRRANEASPPTGQSAGQWAGDSL